MGRHKQWRSLVKRERRRKIRQREAKNREDYQPTFQNTQEREEWLKEQEMLELYEYEQIENSNQIENEKWLEAEKIAIQQWQKLLEKKEALRQKRLEQEAKVKMEWELERNRRIEEEKRTKEIQEENKRKQQLFLDSLEQFLSGDAKEPPAQLLISRETKPEMEPCPFFSKTACCRFGDQCSRNHQYPGISNVLLATNFYIHFGLDNANSNEYDTDLMLEYEDSDTYKEFQDFFFDVLPEFEQFGRVVQFKVCNNHERHLRGNTYIEFRELRAAVSAYRALHSRWYAGRQMSLQFCNVSSWKAAICGLQSRARCPKGRSCNFLHVFKNPNNQFGLFGTGQRWDTDRTPKTPSQTWRWSESPESDRSLRKRSKSPKRRRSRSPKHRRLRSPNRRRSKSPQRRRSRSPRTRSERSERKRTTSPEKRRSNFSKTRSTSRRKSSKSQAIKKNSTPENGLCPDIRQSLSPEQNTSKTCDKPYSRSSENSRSDRKKEDSDLVS